MRTMKWLSMALALSLLSFGCDDDDTQSAGDTDGGVHGGEQAGFIASEEERLLTPAEEGVGELADGMLALGVDIYGELAEEDGNLFFSPFSISQALGMTWAGARGQTEADMASTLHFTQPQAELHEAQNALDLALASRSELPLGEDQEGDNFELNVANAVWGAVGWHFEADFLDTLALNYGAGLRTLDFARDPDAAREIINDWVEEQTEDRIQDLLQQGTVTAETAMVLTNAIYFKASWATAFNEASTRPEPFRVKSRAPVDVPMMHTTGTFRHGGDDLCTVVALPYLGGALSMVVLQPTGSFDDFEADLTTERLEELLGGLTSQRVALSLPKFTFESSFKLKEILTTLGMGIAFQGADFSGMTGAPDLFISNVIHKAFVGVDEEGTEAAAATAVVMNYESVEPEPSLNIDIDSSFLFLILDHPTGAPLFMGRVIDPR